MVFFNFICGTVVGALGEDCASYRAGMGLEEDIETT
jgi:hypothetical protein